MISRNQIILFFTTVLVFILSGYLFWEGLKGEVFNTPLTRPAVDQTEAPQVLGEDQELEVGFEQAKVVKVIDGDTIEVEIEGETQTVRYIGVDTPETVHPRKAVECFGREASGENKRLVEGRIVFLERDISETDQYQRLLRYVYLPLSDGNRVFVNDYLIRQGFGYTLTYPPDVKYDAKFLEAQTEARENNRGLWSSCR